ncbi:MAG: beta-lactamase family protein [Acidimicrobiales bacterium]|nr:beta-lactamase family protein [Acidimicrobiales bacterium]RZV42638.1 MAG: class A beta-lactamase-related serine hydrolase [Acidimicrobiales bacterium]
MNRISTLAESTNFSGVLRLDAADGSVFTLAQGQADRRVGAENETSTRLATASATKGFTALTVMSLIEKGDLQLTTTLRSIVGDALPFVDAAVTIEQLLGHTSGVGDYLDEEAMGDIDEYILDVSAHTLERPADYLPLLNNHPQVSPPGEVFAYNNSGYIMLSIVIEELTGSFHDAVRQRVLEPAGMASSGFFRSDNLPPNTALGYLEDGRTNIFHLPVIGGGDGGIYLTLDDMASFWNALYEGRIVTPESLDAMTTVRNVASETYSYGLGFWLSPDGNIVWLEGLDPGVSFRSARSKRTGAHYTVISNTSSGAWPLVKHCHQLLS